jgi:hypothetical protein
MSNISHPKKYMVWILIGSVEKDKLLNEIRKMFKVLEANENYLGSLIIAIEEQNRVAKN